MSVDNMPEECLRKTEKVEEMSFAQDSGKGTQVAEFKACVREKVTEPRDRRRVGVIRWKKTRRKQ